MDGPLAAVIPLPPEETQFSAQQFNHLDFLSHITNDKRHILDKDNVVAGALFRDEVITAPVTNEELEAS
jgi:hypothetical protein